MPGVLAVLLGSGGGSTFSLTIGNLASVYGFFSGTYGSIAPTTFTDHGGTSRTLIAVNWDINASGTIGLRLNGTGIANTNTTFIQLVINGVVFTRASSSYTANDGTGHTLWNWSADTSAYLTTGTIPVMIG